MRIDYVREVTWSHPEHGEHVRSETNSVRWRGYTVKRAIEERFKEGWTLLREDVFQMVVHAPAPTSHEGDMKIVTTAYLGGKP